MSKFKNIIILGVIVAILVLSYVFFVKPSPDTDSLVSITPLTNSNNATPGESSVAQDFLTLLLNVKNIKLDDAIFSDNVFMKLRDSSITLIGDGSEGRPNPFAPLGVDNIAPAVTTPLSAPLLNQGGDGGGNPLPTLNP